MSDPRVQVVAVCDVDRSRLEAAAALVERHYADGSRSGAHAAVLKTGDFREVVARPEVDAVLVATPDHTHALITLAALRGGKDVYCEKPLAYTVAEGRLVARAVARLGRVLQTGTQRRSNARIRFGCEVVRSGRLGELRTVRVGLPRGFSIRNGFRQANYPAEPVPDGFDYELWLGPAPHAPYTPARCHFNFRWILDYGEGYISDWGAHYLDVAHWGIGADDGGPTEIEGSAIFPADGLYDAPTEFRIEYAYNNGVRMICSTAETLGIRFEGAEGWLHVERPGSPLLTARSPAILASRLGPRDVRLYRSTSQHRNFIDCVLSRRQTAAPAETGHRSAAVCHLGMIACRLGMPLRWDPEAEQFLDNPQAERLLSRPARAPWLL